MYMLRIGGAPARRVSRALPVPVVTRALAACGGGGTCFGDVYYQKRGDVRSFGLANRIVAGVIAAFILMTLINGAFEQ